jgi:hypothetical protein
VKRRHHRGVIALHFCSMRGRLETEGQAWPGDSIKDTAEPGKRLERQMQVRPFDELDASFEPVAERPARLRVRLTGLNTDYRGETE